MLELSPKEEIEISYKIEPNIPVQGSADSVNADNTVLNSYT